MKMIAPASFSLPSGHDIRIAGSEHLFVHDWKGMKEAIGLFQKFPDIRLLPVLDGRHRPVGAIYEKDIRRILFNPYGHALLGNPSFRSDVQAHFRPCPVAEADRPITELLDIYARHGGQDGMILTRGGRFHGVVSSETLLRLAAEREAMRRQAMQQLSVAFQADTAKLAAVLRAASDNLSSTAEETAVRANHNRDHASSVAAAASQVSVSMKDMARQCGHLASALDDLHRHTIEAKAGAEDAVVHVVAGGARAESLATTTQSIEKILDFIQSLAAKINLLALNARIEAAQAGPSGRGFAVVAQEIKALGDQTRTAAGRIADHIRDIQATVHDVVTGHDGMERVITSVDSIFRSVEGAVEHHRLVGRRLADNALEVAQAGEDIHRNIQGIQDSTVAAARTSDEIRGLARSLSDGSITLEGKIAAYVGDMGRA